MFFNVANGQLNELQFVIFMVNLKSRSRWLILLLGGTTRRNSCRSSSHSNRHLMLSHSHRPEQKAQPDFQAPWPLAGLPACGRPEPTDPSPGLRAPHPTSKLRKPVWHPDYGLNVSRAPTRRPAASAPSEPRRGAGVWGAAAGTQAEAILRSSPLFPFPPPSLPLGLLFVRVPTGANWGAWRFRGRRPFPPSWAPLSQTPAAQGEAAEQVCSGAAGTGARGEEEAGTGSGLGGGWRRIPRPGGPSCEP